MASAARAHSDNRSASARFCSTRLLAFEVCACIINSHDLCEYVRLRSPDASAMISLRATTTLPPVAWRLEVPRRDRDDGTARAISNIGVAKNHRTWHGTNGDAKTIINVLALGTCGISSGCIVL